MLVPDKIPKVAVIQKKTTRISLFAHIEQELPKSMKIIKILAILCFIFIHSLQVVDGVKVIYLNLAWKRNTASVLKSPKNMENNCRDGFRADTRNGVCRRMVEFR